MHPTDCSTRIYSVLTSASTLHGRMIFPEKKITFLFQLLKEGAQKPFDSLLKSSLIRHSKLTQRHQHSSNDCQSNRPNLVKHQHQVNQRKRHRLVISYTVHGAKIFALVSFHTAFLDTMRWQVV